MGFSSSWLDRVFPSTCVACGQRGTAFCKGCVTAATSCHFVLGNLPCSAVGHYEGALRTAILALKRGRRDVARRLGEILAERVEGIISSDAILVGVPTARTRSRDRGFDQGPILASIAAKRLEMASVNALCTRSDRIQHAGSCEERWSLVGRFVCVDCCELEGREVILVDDVATTGATLLDSANALRTHGARVSSALVIAYTPRRSRCGDRVDGPFPRG